MAFIKGQCGNPSGRPKGSTNKRTLIRDALAATFPEGEPGFWLAVAQQAKAGDLQAAEMIAKRLYPILKPTSQEVIFSLSGDTPTQQATSILQAIAAGEVPPDTGKLLLDSVAAALGIKEADELAQRIAVLEQRLAEQQADNG